MWERVTNPDHPAFRNYGERGIGITERWLDFEKFLEDMGDRPGPDYSLDRIDNDGPYIPSNCRWATWEQQTRNKRNNVWLNVNGKKMILSDAAKATGIGVDTLWVRINRLKWPEEDWLLPVGAKRARKPAVTKRSRLINYKGEQVSISEAARRSGIKRVTLSARIHRGLPESEWFKPAP